MRDPIQQILYRQYAQLKIDCTRFLWYQRAKDVHELRVAALKAACAIKFFQRYLNADYRDLYRRMLKFRKAMGAMRDADVIDERVKKDAQRLRLSKDKQRALKVWSTQRRAPILKDLLSFMQSESCVSLLSDLEKACQARNEVKLDSQPFISLRLKKHVPRPTQFHHLRMDIKQWRYLMEFLAKAGRGKTTKGDIRAMITIQDYLGDFRDARHTIHALRNAKRDVLPARRRMIKLEKRRARNIKHQLQEHWKSVRLEKTLFI